MKQTMIIVWLALCCAAATGAETYKWTDDQGVINFTDDPARVPSKYRSRVETRADITIRNRTVRQDLWKQNEKRRPTRPAIPRAGTAPDSLPSTTVKEPVKGELGGAQKNPAPPSMKQPVPAPLGEQPTPVPSGMKQPEAAPLGEQPTPTPLGMEQPKAAPLGEQPTPTPLGMEQPEPAR